MLELDTDIKQKFEEAAKAMRLRLRQNPSTGVLRDMILNKGIGCFNLCQRFDHQDLSHIVEKGGVVGVDGKL